MSTYILVDYSNLIHRCKYITSPDIETRTGMALNIILNSLRQVWRKFEGDHIVICLEGKGWRTDYNAQYKAQRRQLAANRTKTEIVEDEFYFEAMHQFSDFLSNKTNVTVLQAKLAEADDFIAHWIYLHPTDKHIIISGDSDFYQLLAHNVTMYDGVKGWTIGIDEVFDENNKPAKTKKTIKEKDPKTGRVIAKTVENLVKPPVPEYELFKKIIRGDPTDNILGAYPGVKEKGSANKPGIIQAFEDRIQKGYEWNQFMLSEWNKLVGIDQDGNSIMKRVRVADEFKANQKLIDLHEQPQEVKDVLAEVIIAAIQRPVSSSVGIRFLQFAKQMDLTTIGNNPTEYAKMLAAPYQKEIVPCQ